MIKTFNRYELEKQTIELFHAGSISLGVGCMGIAIWSFLPTFILVLFTILNLLFAVLNYELAAHSWRAALNGERT